MGMPLPSMFSTFGAIADMVSNRGRYSLKQFFGQFRLFVFVLYDPQSHRDFSKVLEDNFDELDYLSGEHLLFFAPVDPPDSWIRHARRRPYVGTMSQFEREFMGFGHAIHTPDPGITAQAFAKWLGIESDFMPCLVITGNLGSPDLITLKTSDENIQEYLQRLGYLATRYGCDSDVYSRSKFPIEIIAEDEILNGEGDSINYHRLDKSLAHYLFDFLCAVAANEKTRVDPFTREMARQHARKVIDVLENSFRNAKREYSLDEQEENLADVDRFAQNLLFFRTQIKGHIDSTYLSSDALSPQCSAS